MGAVSLKIMFVNPGDEGLLEALELDAKLPLALAIAVFEDLLAAEGLAVLIWGEGGVGNFHD
jgi:hypothetical protein